MYIHSILMYFLIISVIQKRFALQSNIVNTIIEYSYRSYLRMCAYKQTERWREKICPNPNQIKVCPNQLTLNSVYSFRFDIQSFLFAARMSQKCYRFDSLTSSFLLLLFSHSLFCDVPILEDCTKYIWSN